MNIYSNRKEPNVVFVTSKTPREMELEGYVPLVRIYHVSVVEEGEDYKAGGKHGQPVRKFKFSSPEGLKAFNTQGYPCPRTINPEAVTNPECLIAIGQKHRVKYLDQPPAQKQKKSQSNKEKK